MRLPRGRPSDGLGGLPADSAAVMKRRSSRFSLPGTLIALLALIAGIAASVEAGAHHPGSHASLLPNGDVRLEVVVMVSDGCTRIAEVAGGASTPPVSRSGVKPVVVTLSRPDGVVCTQSVGTAHHQTVLKMAEPAKLLHLYVFAPNGSLRQTERLPIRG